MARSKLTPVKVPHSIADALQHHFDSGALGEYPSRNSMLVGLMLYAAIFPKVHRLTVGIAKLPASDQDAIHDFVLASVKQGKCIADMLPKPATAAAMLKLAKAKP